MSKVALRTLDALEKKVKDKISICEIKIRHSPAYEAFAAQWFRIDAFYETLNFINELRKELQKD